MESNTNNISSDQRQRRSETSEEVDVRQGQNALGSLSLSTGLTRSAIMARVYYESFPRLSCHRTQLLPNIKSCMCLYAELLCYVTETVNKFAQIDTQVSYQ